MAQENKSSDPLEFVKSMWGNMGFSLPGMVAPTFDVDELEKRIGDLKAVEGWLRMNLSMLQMTIQGLEMQRTTISAVRAMSNLAAKGGAEGGSAPPPTPGADPAAANAAFAQSALWPWNMINQMQSSLHDQLSKNGAAAAQAASKSEPTPRKPRSSKRS